jgi:hypothetical protein
MVLDREIELARRPPLVDFLVLRLVGAEGHRGVEQIGYTERDRLDSVENVFQLGFQNLLFLTEAGDLGLHRFRLFGAGVSLFLRSFSAQPRSPAHQLSDLLGLGIAQVLQLLRADLHGLALRLERFDRGLVEFVAARAQSLSDTIQLSAQQYGIEHGKPRGMK